MAEIEFALGLTRMAVVGTLRAIEKEAEVKARVQQDLVFMTGEFQMMQAFMSITNAERANNNEVLRTWVRQLRDLAFDVEDWVELVVHLDDKSAAGWWDVVPSCITELLPSSITQLVPSCICELVLPRRPLDDAADEIKLIKARVEEVSQRYTRYNLISNTNSKPAEQPASASLPAFHILRQVWETECGLGLHSLITGDGDQVISAWSSAAGGGDLLGATPILIKAYADPEICKEFERRAWVKMVHPFNLHEFCNSLLAQFYPGDDHFHAEINSQQQVNKHMQRVNKEKYLVILEEVSTVVEWNAIRKCLLQSNNGSRIVVSSRQLGIALLCAGEPPHLVSDLRWSSDGQSLCAFFTKNKSNGEKKARGNEENILGRSGGAIG